MIILIVLIQMYTRTRKNVDGGILKNRKAMRNNHMQWKSCRPISQNYHKNYFPIHNFNPLKWYRYQNKSKEITMWFNKFLVEESSIDSEFLCHSIINIYPWLCFIGLQKNFWHKTDALREHPHLEQRYIFYCKLN